KRRIARACDLLRRSDHTCAEIAFEAGFGSVQHFNRIFRRHQEMSPGKWKQRASPHMQTQPGNGTIARPAASPEPAIGGAIRRS
ncbi:MAG: helix-turn-helix domain-containing protein, partial [Acidobacteria bacterium]|nr:helix-turn-helix domain-containing protein [Acidobacteriota bacterium]